MLLQVKDVVKSFDLPREGFRRRTMLAADHVSFEVGAGEVYGLVGESGSGKTTMGRMICGLERPDSGSILFDGTELAGMPASARRGAARDIQLVFQDSSAAFDPRNRVQKILEEPLVILGEKDASARLDKARAALDSVGLPQAYLDRYPHQLSGGQRQRLNIARALMMEPRFIVCDEPVSALDVSVQAQVLNLLRDLQRKTGVAMLFITHDMRVARHMCDRIGVMRRGSIVEEGPAEQIIAHPTHEYTQTLLSAVFDAETLTE
jgi:peptide/nickel transport system ATP-binding protein